MCVCVWGWGVSFEIIYLKNVGQHTTALSQQ